MEAKFGNGTSDWCNCIFVARMSLNLRQLLSWFNATHNEDFACSWANHELQHQWFLRTPMHLSNASSIAIRAAWVRFGEAAALWMSFLRMHFVRTEQDTEVRYRYLLALTWTSCQSLCFHRFKHTSVVAVQSEMSDLVTYLTSGPHLHIGIRWDLCWCGTCSRYGLISVVPP
jgi:hypothetical protein